MINFFLYLKDGTEKSQNGRREKDENPKRQTERDELHRVRRKKYHIDPQTAKRYAEFPEWPEYTLSAPKPIKLDAYR